MTSSQIRYLCSSCVAVGEGENAAGLVPGGPSVPGPALFAHGDHQDVRPGRTQHGAPLQGRLYVSRSVALLESPSKDLERQYVSCFQLCCRTSPSWRWATTASRRRPRGSTWPRSCSRPTAPSPVAVSFWLPPPNQNSVDPSQACAFDCLVTPAELTGKSFQLFVVFFFLPFS